MRHTDQYGLLLRTETKHGIRRIIAEIVVREDDKDYPANPSTNAWDADMPKHLHGLLLNGLAMRGFVSDMQDFPFIGFGPEYYDRYATDIQAAKRMVRTLTLIGKRIERDAAYSAVDQFAAVCAALKLDFVCERIGPDQGSTYARNRWHWMTTGEGRNRYRALIDTARQEIISATGGEHVAV